MPKSVTGGHRETPEASRRLEYAPGRNERAHPFAMDPLRQVADSNAFRS